MASRSASETRMFREIADGPKGVKVREILESYVAELEPGSPLPSERELAERFSVARMTVRDQIERMVRLGLVYRQRRRGTFVAERRLSHTERLTTFTEDMRARGLEPGARLIGVDTIPAGKTLAARMEVSEGSKLLRIRRVRTADDAPMAVEESYLLAARFRDLRERDVVSGSLYELLAGRFGVNIREATVRITVISLGPEDATLLGIQKGEPALLLERMARDTDGSIVEFASSVYRGDRYEVLLHPQREPLAPPVSTNE